MIILSRQELREIGAIHLLANTPPSLVEALNKTRFVTSLKTFPRVQVLIDDFDRLTSRTGRSSISLGIAYGILIALTLHSEADSSTRVCFSRLSWGEDVVEIARSMRESTRVVVVQGNTTIPHHSLSPSWSTGTASGSTLVIPATRS